MADLESVALSQLPLLYRVALRMTRSPHEAEDLVGQTLLRAAAAWHRFDGAHPRSWLIKIMRNEFLGSIRQTSGRPPAVSLEEFELSEEGLEANLHQRSDVRAILDSLEQLPIEYRLAVTLCDVEELSYEEAAEAMEVPIGTVRSRLSRGRKLLQHQLAGRLNHPAGGA